jgi:YD repeat-containing protein
MASCNLKNESKETTPVQTTEDIKSQDYSKALSLIEAGKYEEAKALFEQLGDYKDSAEYLSKFYYLPAMIYNDIIDKGGSYEYFFNENNLISKYVVHRDGMDAYCEFSYYENGDIKCQFASINGVTQSFEYTYNANRKRETAVHTIDGVVTYLHSFEYDENGNEIVFRIDDVEGNTVQLITRTFDELGNCINIEYVFDDPEYNYTLNIDYIYNDEGYLVREICHYEDGSFETLDYVWNDNENIVKKILTYDDGDQDIWEYTYDEHGNMVKEVLTDYKGTVQYVEYEYVLLYLPTGLTPTTRFFFTEIFKEQI